MKSRPHKNPMLEIVMRPLASLVPYAQNSRTHSAEQVAQIAASITEFGWTNPVLIDAKDAIIAGHGRVMAGSLLGMTEAPCIVLAHLTEAQRRAYVLADNKLALNAGWDFALLQSEIMSLKATDFDLSGIGFSDVELANIIAWKEPNAGLVDPDEAPEPPTAPVSVLGDLWLLGNHRILCGDSTKAEDVRKLMDGPQAQMVFTDPPYGVDYTGGMKKRDRLKNDQIGTDIYGAALPHLQFAADDRAALYLWYADAHSAAAAAAAAAAGYVIVAQIIWAKNHAQFMTSAHYKGKHEPCFYAHRKGRAARWHGPNNEVSLWEYDRAASNDFHPTQKPVALAERALKNSTASGHIVLDIFLGSGSTLIAAEMTGRLGYGLEINPAYVDVAVNRWQNFTGEEATHEDGRTFAQVAADRHGG